MLLSERWMETCLSAKDRFYIQSMDTANLTAFLHLEKKKKF